MTHWISLPHIPGKRRCVKCMTHKLKSEFNPKVPGVKLTRHQLWCKECLASKTYRVPILGASKNNYASRRAVILERKNRPCTDCKHQYHFTAMQFDHVRGEKKFNMSNPVGVSFEELIEEIDKCEVVCANCHHIRTYNRAKHPSDQPASHLPLPQDARN